VMVEGRGLHVTKRTSKRGVAAEIEMSVKFAASSRRRRRKVR